MLQAPRQASLTRCFQERQSWFSNRSSAIFPVHLAQGTDTVIVFLDYWAIKNQLPGVNCLLRVYDSAGRLAGRTMRAVENAHNQISLRELLGEADFEGMVEVEFLSLRDLKFPFPGIMVFYRSGHHFSAVHASGRVRNSDEAYTPKYSVETNWTCRHTGARTPFVHLFNGPRHNGLGEVEIKLMASSTRVLATQTVSFGLEAPFASRIVLLDELFDLEAYAEGDYFAAVRVPDAEFYPRLIVGNFHRDLSFLEATHTFYWNAVPDYVRPPDEDINRLSFLPLMNVPELSLELIGYPTNAPGQVTGRVRTASESGPLEETGQLFDCRTGGDDILPWRKRLEPGLSFQAIDFASGNVPARLNACYRYAVRGAAAPFSTDIAWGAYACDYPARHSHWGHGVVGGGYETVVMVRNMAHRNKEAHDASVALTLYGLDNPGVTREIIVPAESARFCRLRELAGNTSTPQLISWFLKSACPTLDTCWVSFHPDGSICGEHGF